MWDEPLEGVLLERWQLLARSLCDCQPVRIPRCYTLPHANLVGSYHLYGFCDASTTAYAAVVYLALRNGSEHSAKLVACKTRVAPLQSQTIPTLELLGALLLARFVTAVTTSLSIELSLSLPVCYSDSQIALFWIKGVTKDWKPFVHNRVQEIRELVPIDCWHHCSGRDNPADIPTQGVTPLELVKSNLWWHGPPWLGEEINLNSSNLSDMPNECMVELKSNEQSVELIIMEDFGISKVIRIKDYSDLNKLLGVTAHVIMVIDRLKQKLEPPCHIDFSYLSKAECLWLRDVQRELVTREDFNTLRLRLDLFYDEVGIWRCGGRLSKADMPYSTKHPIILPRSHHYTLLVVRRAHNRVLHSGAKETLTEVRSKYWVVKGRAMVKRVVHSCVICRRFEGLPYQAPPPPPLPSFRVNEQPPFTYTGVDYAGPLFVKPDHPLQAHCDQKVWICLYTCCVTRAVHIDIVTNLSCHSFLRSFKRFTSRRGLPHRMLSDNGSTFKSASNVIKKIVSDPAVSKHLAGVSVEWYHNLEKAPWWGGLFERLIGMTKRCLRKAIGRAKFTYDELLTAVTEIEAILNSRPLSYVSSGDLEEPLTPFHLINGRRLTNLPDELCFHRIEEEFTTISSPVLLNKRMRHLQLTLDRFWKRWRGEYLLSLRERYQYKNQRRADHRKISEGDIVIIHEDQTVGGFWRLGKIRELITGLDGQTRGAVVDTVSGGRSSLLRRPVQKLYPLEISQEEESETRDTRETQGGSIDQEKATNDSGHHGGDLPESWPSEVPADTHLSTPSCPRRSAAVEAHDKIFASLCED